MTRILFSKTFAGEHMTQMRTAGGTNNFGPSSVGIGNTFYRTRDFVVKGRPSAMRIEFIVGMIKRCIALTAYIRACLLIVGVLAGKSPFGAFVQDNAMFFGCEFI